MPERRPGIQVEDEAVAETRLAPRFHVVLWNDDDHSYDYVIDLAARLFGKSLADAYAHAKEVDTTGRTILLTTALEQAEWKRDQIHAFGADPRIARSQGSMSATVEPAE